RVYRIVPEKARVSVSNFFSNVFTPIRFANALVQLKFRDAGTELGRLLINSTIGIGGLFDPAKNIYGIRKKSEDFGQTLGHYGIGQGFYLVLPIFGPSSLRDGLGDAVDAYYLNPINTLDLKDRDKYTLWALDQINALSLDRDTYEAIKRESLDPYVFVRDAYSQNRAGKVRK
ncbi:MAG: VacJ family lipoprotein, partial [bacterium]